MVLLFPGDGAPRHPDCGELCSPPSRDIDSDKTSTSSHPVLHIRKTLATCLVCRIFLHSLDHPVSEADFGDALTVPRCRHCPQSAVCIAAGTSKWGITNSSSPFSSDAPSGSCTCHVARQVQSHCAHCVVALLLAEQGGHALVVFLKPLPLLLPCFGH